MGIKVVYTTNCDNSKCDKVVTKTFDVNKDFDKGVHYPDIFSPGWVEGWMQVNIDKKILFFCCDSCYVEYIREHKGEEEAKKKEKELKHSIWTA